MKKSVKSKKDLDSLASELGAVVRKMPMAQAQKKETPDPSPPQLPASAPDTADIPSKLDKTLELLAEKIEAAGAENSRLLESLYQQMAAASMDSPRPVMEWVFDVSRDKEGISQIRARAVSVDPIPSSLLKRH